MSLRDKAREVKEAGVAERGNFTPTGVPKRIYQWWLSESNSRRARRVREGRQRENFCHFWRVVLFWAPLRKAVYLGEKIAPYAGAAVVLAVVVAIIVALFVSPMVVLETVAAVAGLAYLLFGFLGGVSFGMSPSQRRRNDMITNKTALALSAIALPTFALGYGLTRSGRFYSDHLTDHNKEIGLGAGVAVLLAAVTTIVLVGGWGTLASWVIVVAIAAVGLAFIIGVCVTLATYIDGKRAIAKAKREDREAVYVAEYGHLPVHVPSAFEIRLKKILSGAADFIVLIAQVVRVKKWKICPMVEIEDDRAAA